MYNEGGQAKGIASMTNSERRQQPAPRKRPSVKDGRRVVGTARDASSGTGKDAKRGPIPEHRVATRHASRPGAAVSSFNKIYLALGGAAVVLLVLILVLAFSCGKRDAAESSGSPAAAAGSSAAAQANKNPGPYSVSFCTTGDLIFWREVADYIDANGGASAMANIAGMLSTADVTISNLESPLSDNDSEPVYDKDVYIIGKPSAIEGMVNSGIDIVSLANNHIMDYTGPALQDTLNALDAKGILHAGAGMNEADADKMVETTVNGVSIAFLSWTDIVPDNYVAYKDEPGVASARLNMNDALKRVREAKEAHDVVIVAMHWGIEYQDYADEAQQIEPAHQLVDAGADVVLGNHPHVPQGIEFYNGSLIAYAHGNCVFRQDPSFGNTHESYVLNFDITEEGVKNVVVTPLYLSDEYGIPSVATGEQADAELAHLAEISEGMNTAFDLRDGKAHLSPIR